MSTNTTNIHVLNNGKRRCAMIAEDMAYDFSTGEEIECKFLIDRKRKYCTDNCVKMEVEN
jgi:hypothetical protein